MIKKTLKILFFIIGLAVYLNIGWALGTYMYDNVRYSTELRGAMAVFLAGPDKMLNDPTIPKTEISSKTEDQICFSLFWPLEIMLLIGSWVVYWILWLMFAGGIAKLFGVG